MSEIIRATKEQLLRIGDPAYRAFQIPLIPTVSPDTVIGVRVPQLRRMAKKMTRDGRAQIYLSESILPHETYDEMNLHAFLIEGIADFDTCMHETEQFLPYIDNWATCDMFSPSVFSAEPIRLYEKICAWLQSDAEFTVRFGLVMLMRYFLGERFSPEIPVLAAQVRHTGYYVQMAVAWLFAEALARQWADALPYVQDAHLTPWVRRKAIQKALESRKLNDTQKAYLRALREEGRQG